MAQHFVTVVDNCGVGKVCLIFKGMLERFAAQPAMNPLTPVSTKTCFSDVGRGPLVKKGRQIGLIRLPGISMRNEK